MYSFSKMDDEIKTAILTLLGNERNCPLNQDKIVIMQISICHAMSLVLHLILTVMWKSPCNNKGLQGSKVK